MCVPIPNTSINSFFQLIQDCYSKQSTCNGLVSILQVHWYKYTFYLKKCGLGYPEVYSMHNTLHTQFIYNVQWSFKVEILVSCIWSSGSLVKCMVCGSVLSVQIYLAITDICFLLLPKYVVFSYSRWMVLAIY